MQERKIIHTQQGAVLIVGMLMLIVMTLIGLTGMRMTTFEERMAGNVKDKHMAFEAAEAALRAGENFIEDTVITTGTFDAVGTDGLYNDDLEEIWDLVDWKGTDAGNNNEVLVYSTFYKTSNPDIEVATLPKYVIQHYGTNVEAVDNLNLDNYGGGTGAGQTEMFRVTARGTGGSDNTVVILQTTFGKRL